MVFSVFAGNLVALGQRGEGVLLRYRHISLVLRFLEPHLNEKIAAGEAGGVFRDDAEDALASAAAASLGSAWCAGLPSRTGFSAGLAAS